MKEIKSHPVITHISNHLESLSPKARVLGKYIMQHPSEVVFMTTRELAENSSVSEATVVRLVNKLGYSGYSEFQQALKDFVNTGLSLPERAAIKGIKEPGVDLLHRGILEELNNLKYMYEHISIETLNQIVGEIKRNPSVYVVGSRLSYTFAYYLGWSLTKIQKGIHILKGSDTTAMDWLNNASDDALVIMMTTSRYPNELIRLARMIRRSNMRLIAITDSDLCPINQFAEIPLVIPSQSIPFIGSVSGFLAAIQYMVQELANQKGEDLGRFQQQLEQVYLENDILFNLDH